MLNTTTLCHLYKSFCEEGSSVPTKPSANGFVNLVTNSFFLPVFIAFCNKMGYTVQQFEDWEKETFIDGSPDAFFEDVEYTFRMMGD